MRLTDKVALVTGAGSGIGKATALLLAREGAKVGALSHTIDEARKTIEEITNEGGDGLALFADVANPDQMERAARELAELFGGIDIVFANAGINGVWAPIEQLKPEEWDKTLNTNLKGTFLTIKYAVPYLKRKGGSVVVTSSVNGTRMFSNTGATAYSASKAGQVALVKMLAVELGKHKVRVNVVCPGAIDTEIDENTEKRNVEKEKPRVEFPQGQIPLTGKKPGSADEVAQLVLFLVSDDSRHITGTEIWIDGAQSLLQG